MKNKKMIRKTGLIVLTLITSAFMGCKSGSTEANLNEDMSDSLKISTDSISEIEEEVTYKLPSALQIAYVSRKSGAGYNASILNNTENVAKYNTSNYKRAVNFGIYSSDLANCLFNKKYQESKQYLKALKEIGAYLGLNQAFETDNLAERFDKNIGNEDSLVKIVSNVQLKTDILFEQNKQKHITVIAFAGAWIESLNIAGEAYFKEKNKKILTSFFEQMLLAPTLIKALNATKTKEEEMPELQNAIINLNEAFYALPEIKAAIDKEIEMDFSTMKFNDKDIKKLTDIIKELRTKMVN